MKRFFALAAALLAASTSVNAQSLDQLVQAPALAAPERGSLAGQLSSTAFGPADLSRGAFSLASPFSVPEERGPLQAPIFPTWSPDAGASEWGNGWQARLAITRFRVSGDLDYATDELTSPWGRCHLGTDGNWYPAGLATPVRIVPQSDGFIAWLPDGTQWIFGGAARVNAPLGTYAWNLRQVVGPTNRKTNLTWTANASGRLFLTGVDYGGVGDDLQAHVAISYAPLAQPFTDLRSGVPLVLDQSVSAVAVSVKSAATSTLAPRFSFALSYLHDPIGPAFYLASVQKTFASGQKPPPTTYDYQLSGEVLQAAALRPVPAFDGVIAQWGASIALPSQSTAFDVDQDGAPDLEVAADYTLLRQTPQGFEAQPLAANPNALPECRAAPSGQNLPRTLAQMRAADSSWQVVSLAPSAATGQTNLTLCARDGSPAFLGALPGFWQLGPNSRLVDLDGDHQPDLIQVYPGGYDVVPNRSTAAGFAFGATVHGSLQLDFQPDATWVQDFNGDGIPDLVVRSGPTLVVYLGAGNFQFQQQGQVVALQDGSGGAVDPTPYQLTFVDANNDGLADLLLSGSDGSVFLFINTGSALVYTPVPALASVAFDAGLPMFLDLAGSGEAEAFFTSGGGALSLSLTSPGLGLLRAADDGAGTVLRFGYARAPASAGQRARHRLLAALTIDSAGQDERTIRYDYSGAVAHSLGQFLVGFGHVSASDAVVSDGEDFLNTDEVSGLASASLKHDLNAPGADAFETRAYDEVTSFGLPWKRLRSIVAGFQTAGQPQVSHRTDYLAYSGEICPTQLQQQSGHGTLVTVETLASPAGLVHSLHCLAAQSVFSGAHDDPTLDFRQVRTWQRNAAGQITQVASQAPGETLLLQTVAYNADGTVASIALPGQGTSSYGYDPATHLLSRLTAPDGVVTTAAARDPVADGLLTLAVARPAATYQRFFRYDGQERLARHWDSLGGGTDGAPKQSLTYRTASAALPAAAAIATLVDAGQGIARQEVDFFTAGGAPIAEATRIPEGWAFGEVTQRLVSTAQINKLRKPTLPASAVAMALSYADLQSGGQLVASSRTSAYGHAAEKHIKLHADVEQLLTAGLALSPAGLSRSTLENGSNGTTEWLDAEQRVTRRQDEAQASISFTYDALGRLRDVVLPGGPHHRRDYDAHGRVSAVRRDGIASITWAYQPTTSLVESKSFAPAASGPALRQVQYGYDGIGRKIIETHVDPIASVTQTYRFFWDGATPANPTPTGLSGLLTGVSGDGFSKVFDYRIDGLLAHRAVTVTGLRTVDTVLGYFEDGTIQTKTSTVRDGGGAQLSSSTEVFLVDAAGRPRALQLNGAPAATLSYDGNGQLASVVLANGSRAQVTYDPLTRMETGLSETGPGWSSATSLRFDTRGLPAQETIAVGGTARTRGYTYSPQKYLVAASDALGSYAYGFDASGVPTFLQAGAVRTTLTQSGSQLTAGALAVNFDGLGRATDEGALHLTYGPNGQVQKAQRGAAAWSFVTDETGRRLAKLSGGLFVSGSFEEGYLDASGLTEPLTASGMLVGVIRSGAATTLPVDTRGTLLGDSTGAAHVASPFGARDVHPDLAAALDYVRQGYDKDLGTLRMGVRDYDPALNRFLTPDPLFLEEPQRCGADVADCNLYAYARNAPTLYADRSGHVAQILVGAGVGGAISVGAYLIFTPRSEWSARGAGGAFVGGAISGGVAAATLGASLAWQSAAAAGSSLAGGVIGRAIETGNASEALDGKKMLVDTVGGALGPAVAKGVGFLRGAASRVAAQAEQTIVSRFAARAPAAGATAVYRALDPVSQKVIYIGITDDLTARALAHARQKGIQIAVIPGLEAISRQDARAVEQVLIELYEGPKGGAAGGLINKINSIAVDNGIYSNAINVGNGILKYIGYSY